MDRDENDYTETLFTLRLKEIDISPYVRFGPVKIKLSLYQTIASFEDSCEHLVAAIQYFKPVLDGSQLDFTFSVSGEDKKTDFINHEMAIEFLQTQLLPLFCNCRSYRLMLLNCTEMKIASSAIVSLLQKPTLLRCDRLTLDILAGTGDQYPVMPVDDILKWLFHQPKMNRVLRHLKLFSNANTFAL